MEPGVDGHEYLPNWNHDRESDSVIRSDQYYQSLSREGVCEYLQNYMSNYRQTELLCRYLRSKAED
jgi:hypothetical protein